MLDVWGAGSLSVASVGIVLAPDWWVMVQQCNSEQLGVSDHSSSTHGNICMLGSCSDEFSTYFTACGVLGCVHGCVGGLGNGKGDHRQSARNSGHASDWWFSLRQ